MSLRRSARNHAASVTEAITKPPPAKKRARPPPKPNDASILSIPASQDADGFTIPATPSPAKKRRRAAPTTPIPPITPTPAAIGIMMTPRPSTGDIDDATPTVPRPASPHHTNAPLHTPSGPTILPFPRPRGIIPRITGSTATLLSDAKAHLLRADPSLQPVIAAHHCRVFDPTGLAEEIDPFRSLASGIMAQQVSGAAASSIKKKFIGLWPANGGEFPTPGEVRGAGLARLREAGLSGRKAEYIQGLAEKFDTGELSAEWLAGAEDEEVMERLVAVRGLGRWSVEMFCCFGLKRMDVFSTGDLGVQRGMAAYKGRDVNRLKNKGGKWKYMSEQEMVETAEKFRPYRSLFMWYMWRIEDVPEFGGKGGTNVDAIQNAT